MAKKFAPNATVTTYMVRASRVKKSPFVSALSDAETDRFEDIIAEASARAGVASCDTVDRFLRYCIGADPLNTGGKAFHASPGYGRVFAAAFIGFQDEQSAAKTRQAFNRKVRIARTLLDPASPWYLSEDDVASGQVKKNGKILAEIIDADTGAVEMQTVVDVLKAVARFERLLADHRTMVAQPDQEALFDALSVLEQSVNAARRTAKSRQLLAQLPIA